jgi:hypothetical protein
MTKISATKESSGVATRSSARQQVMTGKKPTTIWARLDMSSASIACASFTPTRSYCTITHRYQHGIMPTSNHTRFTKLTFIKFNGTRHSRRNCGNEHRETVGPLIHISNHTRPASFGSCRAYLRYLQYTFRDGHYSGRRSHRIDTSRLYRCRLGSLGDLPPDMSKDPISRRSKLQLSAALSSKFSGSDNS